MNDLTYRELALVVVIPFIAAGCAIGAYRAERKQSARAIARERGAPAEVEIVDVNAIRVAVWIERGEARAVVAEPKR